MKNSLNKKRNRLLIIVLFMFLFGFMLIPIYRSICKITGINNIVQRDLIMSEIKNIKYDNNRTISVEFDANTKNDLLNFKPEKNNINIHLGELVTILFNITNKQKHTIQIQAIPSFAPQQSEQYFKKIECFCFTKQTLQPYESKKFPVVFIIDSKLPKDIKTITLSYTFFELK